VSSSQFSLGSIFVAFCPKGLFIKAVQLLFQPVSPGRCMIFCLNKVNNRANVYPKNTTTTFIEQTYIWLYLKGQQNFLYELSSIDIHFQTLSWVFRMLCLHCTASKETADHCNKFYNTLWCFLFYFISYISGNILRLVTSIFMSPSWMVIKLCDFVLPRK
jgi:hypothetical protein